MAVVSVLWTLTLLSAIAISLSFAGTTSYKIAHNSFQTAYDSALADAALNRAVLALLDPRQSKRWPVNGTPQIFEFAGASIKIRVQDELGKIDLNHTNASVLSNLFQSAGLDAITASALVDKVLDWREEGEFKRINGAKTSEYRAAGYNYRPREGPYQSVDELMLVMGMTRDLFRRVEPALTVYSGRPFIDPRFAPPEVLSALPAFNRSNSSSPQLSAAVPLVVNPMTALKGRAFSIQVEISRSTNTVKHEGAVRLTGNPDDPFWTLSWDSK